MESRPGIRLRDLQEETDRLRDLQEETEAPGYTEVDPDVRIQQAIETCLARALDWLGWSGEVAVAKYRLWTPTKSLRRITDHLIDHLAQIEALAAGAMPLPDTWHGSYTTLDSDWARFTEQDYEEATARLRRLGQVLALRLGALGAEEWDRPRDGGWTIRQIVEHLADSVVWYAGAVTGPRS